MLFKSLGICFFFVVSACFGANSPSSISQKVTWASYSVFTISDDGRFGAIVDTIGVNGETNLTGDVVFHVKFCPRNSPFICVHGEIIKDHEFYGFAVPRRELHVGDKWTFAGKNYELIPAYRIVIPGGRVPHSQHPIWMFDILNNRLNVDVIRTSQEIKDRRCTNVYFYSPEHGLIGDMGSCEAKEAKDLKFSWSDWLQGTDGIGAPAFENAIPSKADLTNNEVEILSQQRNY